MTLVLALVFGLLIGVLLGMIGGGGSILTVPILVYVLGLDVHDATATSLVIVGATSLFGLAPHARQGRLAYRTALIFGGIGIAGSIAGTALSDRVSGPVLLVLFGAIMLVVAGRMARKKSQATATEESREAAGKLPVLLAGLATGFMTGFFGVGGGFLIVPVLTLMLRLPMRLAIGTSLAIIVINSAAGIVARGGMDGIDYPLALAFIAGGGAGAIAGGNLAGRVNERRLATGFAVLIATVGIYLMLRNLYELA